MKNKRPKQKIFMVRHGKPDFPDLESYIYGHTDYPLSETGKEQARGLAEALSGVLFDRAVSSDLARAHETARIIMDHQSERKTALEARSDFREIYMGDWEGMNKKHIAEQFSELFEIRGKSLSSVSAPGGENFTQLQERAAKALWSVLSECGEEKNILMVAHGGFFWSLICLLFKMGLDDIFSFGFDYCGVHLLERRVSAEFDRADFRLMRYNWSPRLENYLENLV